MKTAGTKNGNGKSQVEAARRKAVKRFLSYFDSLDEEDFVKTVDIVEDIFDPLHEIRKGNNNGNGKLHLATAAQQLRDLAKEFADRSIQTRQVALEAIEILQACSDLLTSDMVDALKDCYKMLRREIAEKSKEQEQAQPQIGSEMDIEFIEKWKREIKDYDKIAEDTNKTLRRYNPLLQKAILMDLYLKLPEQIKEQEEEQRADAADGALLAAVSGWPVEKIEMLARVANKLEFSTAA